MCQDHPNLLEWPRFAVSIHTKGHVRTCPQRGQQQLVRVRPLIVAARCLRFIREQLVPTHRNDLAQTGGTTSYRYSSRHFLPSSLLPNPPNFTPAPPPSPP